MFAVVYARVSTEEQAQQGSSLEDQAATCERHARALGAVDVQVFRDVASGSVLQRPGLEALRERIACGGVGLFVCYDPDRLARNLSHQLLLTEEFERAGVRLEFVNFEWKNTPEGKLFYSLRGAIAEYEREKIRERTMRGKLRRAREQRLTHNPRTYGYRYCPEGKAFAVDPSEAAVVRQMFEWFVDGDLGYHGIARRLTEMGIPSPEGSVWQKMTVRRILANTAYVGLVYLHRHDTVGVRNSRRLPPCQRLKRRERPRDEWIPVAVPAIVDPEVFGRAQQKSLEVRRRYAGSSRAEYLLSGLVSCGVCGCTVHGFLSSPPGRVARRYYVCTARNPGRRGRAKCVLPYLPADDLERLVWERVVGWLRDPGAFQRDLVERANELLAPLERAISDIEAQLADYAEQGKRLIDLYQRGLVPLVEVEGRLKSLSGAVSALSARRADLLRRASQVRLTTEDLDRFAHMAAGVVDQLDELDFDGRRSIVRRLMVRVTVHADAVVLDVRLPGDPGEASDGGGFARVAPEQAACIDVCNDTVRGRAIDEGYLDGRDVEAVQGVVV
ncbi:MAG: recombinase family protein [Bacillota bacterium]